jgi:hypothetical protein
LNRCAVGSVICFDFFTQALAFSPRVERSMKRLGEPFKFAMSRVDSDVTSFLARPNLRLALLENITTDELMVRYMPLQRGDNRRYLGSIGDFGGFVVARSSKV